MNLDKKKGILFLQPVPEEDSLVLISKSKVRSLPDLFTALESMPDDVFGYHVSFNKNDFSDWIRLQIKDSVLANKIHKAETREEMAIAIKQRINDHMRGSSDRPGNKSAKAAEKRPKEKAGKDSGKKKKKQENKKFRTRKFSETKKKTIQGKSQKRGKNMKNNNQSHKKIASRSASGDMMFFAEGVGNLSNLIDLLEALEMNGHLFSRHVGQGFDHFADWIEHALLMKGLAKELRKIKDRDKYIAAISKKVKPWRLLHEKPEIKAETKKIKETKAKKKSKTAKIRKPKEKKTIKPKAAKKAKPSKMPGAKPVAAKKSIKTPKAAKQAKKPAEKKKKNAGNAAKEANADSRQLKEIIEKENLILKKEQEIELREKKIHEVEQRIESKLNEMAAKQDKPQKKEKFLSRDFLQGVAIGILLTVLLALIYINFISPLGLIPWL